MKIALPLVVIYSLALAAVDNVQAKDLKEVMIALRQKRQTCGQGCGSTGCCGNYCCPAEPSVPTCCTPQSQPPLCCPSSTPPTTISSQSPPAPTLPPTLPPTQPPQYVLSTTLLPSIVPSSTLPPTTVPSPTLPPSTLPPLTLPPLTLPPPTLPPPTLPPPTLPPPTLPPPTLPPPTLPPQTLPPSTLPPQTLPPPTVPPPIQSPPRPLVCHPACQPICLPFCRPPPVYLLHPPSPWQTLNVDQLRYQQQLAWYNAQSKMVAAVQLPSYIPPGFEVAQTPQPQLQFQMYHPSQKMPPMHEQQQATSIDAHVYTPPPRVQQPLLQQQVQYQPLLQGQSNQEQPQQNAKKALSQTFAEPPQGDPAQQSHNVFPQNYGGAQIEQQQLTVGYPDPSSQKQLPQEQPGGSPFQQQQQSELQDQNQPKQQGQQHPKQEGKRQPEQQDQEQLDQQEQQENTDDGIIATLLKHLTG